MIFVTVPDPDFEIRGGRSSRPLDKGREGLVSQKIFPALRASVWSKNRGGRGGLPGPSPGSATVLTRNRILLMLQLHPWTKRGEKILGGRSGKSLPPFSLSVLVFSFLFLVYCTVCFVASYK